MLWTFKHPLFYKQETGWPFLVEELYSDSTLTPFVVGHFYTDKAFKDIFKVKNSTKNVLDSIARVDCRFVAWC